jgi:hypothetical protein
MPVDRQPTIHHLLSPEEKKIQKEREIRYFTDTPIEKITVRLLNEASKTLAKWNDRMMTMRLGNWINEHEDDVTEREQIKMRPYAGTFENINTIREPSTNSKKYLYPKIDPIWITKNSVSYTFPYRVLFSNDTYFTSRQVFDDYENTHLPGMNKVRSRQAYTGKWVSERLENKKKKNKITINDKIYSDKEDPDRKYLIKLAMQENKEEIKLKTSKLKGNVKLSRENDLAYNYTLTNAEKLKNAYDEAKSKLDSYAEILSEDYGKDFHVAPSIHKEFYNDIHEHILGTVLVGLIVSDFFGDLGLLVKIVSQRFEQKLFHRLRPKVPIDLIKDIDMCFLFIQV